MNIKYDFTGKVCIVTGGASGMGAAFATALAESGAEVFIADVQLEKAREMADKLNINGCKTHALYLDATKEQSAVDMAAEAVKQAGRIDIMVNCVGIGAGAKDGETPFDTFNRVMAVNIHGIYNCCIAVGEEMIKQGGGTIVNMGSLSTTVVPEKTRPGRGGEYGLMGYCTAKGGVKMLTKAIAALWAPYGVRCNCVSPGYVDTPLTAVPHSNPEIRAKMESGISLGYIAQPEDIVGPMLFLLTDEAHYITGEELVVDGGFLIR